MLGTSNWFQANQPSRNDSTSYETFIGSQGYGGTNDGYSRKYSWNADKITGLTLSTSIYEKLQLCNLEIQTSKELMGFDCEGGILSDPYKKLTDSSHLVSKRRWKGTSLKRKHYERSRCLIYYPPMNNSHKLVSSLDATWMDRPHEHFLPNVPCLPNQCVMCIGRRQGNGV